MEGTEAWPRGLVSGEGVRLALIQAGVASRVIAALIDVVIQFVALLVLALLDQAAAGDADVAGARALLIAELVLVLAGYPIVMEWTTRGRTVGKMCLGLRVVRDDGGPIGFRQALTRGLAGLILEKPGLAGPLTLFAGVATMTASTQDKRIGDMMAGTIVLNERAAPQAAALLPMWAPVPLQGWLVNLDMQRMDDELALLLRQFVGRAHAMSFGAQHQLGHELMQRVLAVTSPPPPVGAPVPAVLAGVLTERRRRAMGVQQAPRRPAPPGYSPHYL